MGDAKHAQTKLNSELDDYFSQKAKKTTDAVEEATDDAAAVATS